MKWYTVVTIKIFSTWCWCYYWLYCWVALYIIIIYNHRCSRTYVYDTFNCSNLFRLIVTAAIASEMTKENTHHYHHLLFSLSPSFQFQFSICAECSCTFAIPCTLYTQMNIHAYMRPNNWANASVLIAHFFVCHVYIYNLIYANKQGSCLIYLFIRFYLFNGPIKIYAHSQHTFTQSLIQTSIKSNNNMAKKHYKIKYKKKMGKNRVKIFMDVFCYCYFDGKFK